MAMTFMIRKRCVRPLGTMGTAISTCRALAAAGVGMRTLSVVVEVGKLIAPLCNDTECVLQESDNDEEAANCGHVSVQEPGQSR